MVVQHNLTAMNSNRQLGITTGIQAKSSEKLSSGYKINRAADDAAGLAISEKMRRQIRGLTQASANSQDGISFVQIADGALHEVHDMIQRGNELAVKAANDTLTSLDRTYINAEITKLKEEINSIGGKTTFNEIPIFPKDGSSISDATSAQIELAKDIAKNYVPKAVSQIVSKLTGSVGTGLSNLASATANKNDYGINMNITYIDGPGNTLAYMQSAFYPNNPGADSFAKETLFMKVDSADFKDANITDAMKQELESTVAHELMHGVMDILLPEGMYRNDTADNNSGNFKKWFVEGTAQLVGGGFTTGWNDGLIKIATSGATDSEKETAVSNYLKNGQFDLEGKHYSYGSGSFTVEGRPYGHGYLACAYLCQLASGAGDEVTQESLIQGADRIFNALMDNEKNYKENGTAVSFESAINSVLPAGNIVNSVMNAIDNGNANAASFVLKLATKSQEGVTGSLPGAGSLIAGSLSSVNILGGAASEDQPMFVKNYNSDNTETDGATVLYLQVGSETTSPNEIGLKRFALSAAALGIEQTNTLTNEDALEAISQFKGALLNVSTMRSYYGAMQNRLEHTIKNLNNVVENTTAAESLIRDTNMADEMVRYSNNNILAQAGQSMLAQANQTNQGVLSLLQ